MIRKLNQNLKAKDERLTHSLNRDTFGAFNLKDLKEVNPGGAEMAMWDFQKTRPLFATDMQLRTRVDARAREVLRLEFHLAAAKTF